MSPSTYLVWNAFWVYLPIALLFFLLGCFVGWLLWRRYETEAQAIMESNLRERQRWEAQAKSSNKRK